VPSARFEFFLCAWATLRHLDTVGRKELALRLSSEFPLWRDDGLYSTSLLAEWFQRQAQDLEAQFNARNGTARYSEIVKEKLALEQWATDWPLEPGRKSAEESATAEAE
jgi:hypothetical protein